MRKRMLSFALALCLLLALMPQTSLTVWAAKSDTDVAYAVEGGNIYFDKETGTITDCDDTVTAVEIPDEILGVAVTTIGENAFSYRWKLTSVTIGNNVTTIEDSAFKNSPYLSSVVIPDSVESIGKYAFYYTKLSSVTIGSNVISIGDNAFGSCSSLTGIEVDEGNLYYSSDDSGALFNKDKTELILVPRTKAEGYTIPHSVTRIGNDAFRGCSTLTNITIPDSVETIGEYAFYECENLTTVTIGSGVVSIGSSAFKPYDGTQLNLLTVCFLGDAPSIGEEVFRAKYIGEFADGYMEYPHLILYYMDGNTGWTSPEWNGYPTATWDGINLPERNTAYAVEGGNLYFDKAFGMIIGCDDSVTSADIPTEIDGTAVTEIGEKVFSGHNNLTSVTIPGNVKTIGSYAFEDCENLTSVILEEGITNIETKAFYRCSSLSDFHIPASVTRIGQYAFSDTLFSNTAENWTGAIYDAEEDYWTDGILYKDNWLLQPRNLSRDYALVIPEGIVGIADYAFWDCMNSLKSVVFPSTIKTIPMGAFGFCWQLTGAVTIPEGVREIKDKAFVGCNLTSISIPASVTSIGDDVFTECSYLTGIWVDEKNPNYSSDDRGVLFNKNKTELIKAPGALEGEYAVPNGVTTIDAKAFSYSRLTDVTIPNTVEEIGERAFEMCYFLISATLPRNITSLERGTFYFCNELTSVYFCGDAPELGENVFYRISYDGTLPTLTLYYAVGKSGWTSPTWNGYNTATWEPPHEHSYTTVVTAPTCVDRGYTTYTCECGDSYVGDYVDALGHDFVINTCSRCGAKGTGKSFSDVSDKAWFYDYVVAASNLGLVTGFEDNTFRPFDQLTRAQAATLLYRAAGSPAVTGKATFTDLDGQWYQDAICWAQKNGVVNGISATEFAPNEPVTREAFLTMIWRAAGRPDATGNLNEFKDTATVDEWAVTAFAWAVEQGIINGTTLPGKTGLHLAPLNNITRAEASKMLVVYTSL